MILQYVSNTGIQDFIWVFQHALKDTESNTKYTEITKVNGFHYLVIVVLRSSARPAREPSQITFAFRGGGQKNARFTT